MMVECSMDRVSFLTDLCLGSSSRSADLPMYFVISSNGNVLSCSLFASFLKGNWKLSGVSYHLMEYVIPVQVLHPSLNLQMLDCLNVNTECIDSIRYFKQMYNFKLLSSFTYFYQVYHMPEVGYVLECLTGLSSCGWKMNHLRRATCK